jgi:hypothetical protein
MVLVVVADGVWLLLKWLVHDCRVCLDFLKMIKLFLDAGFFTFHEKNDQKLCS